MSSLTGQLQHPWHTLNCEISGLKEDLKALKETIEACDQNRENKKRFLILETRLVVIKDIIKKLSPDLRKLILLYFIFTC